MRNLAVLAAVFSGVLAATPASAQIAAGQSFDSATMVQKVTGWTCKTAGWIRKSRKNGNMTHHYCVKGVSSGDGVKNDQIKNRN